MKNSKVSSKSVLVFRLSILLIIVGCFGLSSCEQNTFGDKDQLMAYLNDESNGFLQQKTINGVDFKLMYKPTDLIVRQAIKDTEYSNKEIDSLRQTYKDYLYFNLNISKNQQELLSTVPNNRNEFSAMVNQLVFGMRDKVNVFNKQKDTLDMIDYIYPRLYGMSKSTSMLFIYPRDSDKIKDGYINFTIEDFGLYIGEIKFKIPTENILNEPQIELKS